MWRCSGWGCADSEMQWWIPVVHWGYQHLFHDPQPCNCNRWGTGLVCLAVWQHWLLPPSQSTKFVSENMMDREGVGLSIIIGCDGWHYPVKVWGKREVYIPSLMSRQSMYIAPSALLAPLSFPENSMWPAFMVKQDNIGGVWWNNGIWWWRVVMWQHWWCCRHTVALFTVDEWSTAVSSCFIDVEFGICMCRTHHYVSTHVV